MRPAGPANPRLVQYIVRNPFSVEKIQVGDPSRANPDGSIIYRSGLNPKIQRNFEVFSPCDFILLRSGSYGVPSARRSRACTGQRSEPRGRRSVVSTR